MATSAMPMWRCSQRTLAPCVAHKEIPIAALHHLPLPTNETRMRYAVDMRFRLKGAETHNLFIAPNDRLTFQFRVTDRPPNQPEPFGTPL